MQQQSMQAPMPVPAAPMMSQKKAPKNSANKEDSEDEFLNSSSQEAGRKEGFKMIDNFHASNGIDFPIRAQKH